MLRTYTFVDERVRVLALVVKHWAKSRGINDVNTPPILRRSNPHFLFYEVVSVIG